MRSTLCLATGCASVLLLLAPGACERHPTDPGDVDWNLRNHYQLGNAALSEGRLAAAEVEYRQVLELDRKNLPARTKLARVLCERAAAEPAAAQAVLAEARRLLDEVLKSEPDDRLAWAETARVARRAGDVKRAMQALTKLRELEPGTAEHVIAIAELQQEQNHADQAEAVLREALAGKGDAGPIHLALGRLLLRQNREQEARALFEAVVACPAPSGELVRPPPCPTAAYYEAQDELGSLAARQGRLEDARQIYSNLVGQFPEDYMAWEVLAALDEKEGRFIEAEKKYRQSLDIDRAHSSVWRGLARALTAQGRLDEARYALRKADGFLNAAPEQALELADELVAVGEPAWASSMLARARILAGVDAKLVEAIERKAGEVRAVQERAAVEGASDGGVGDGDGK